MYQRDYFLRLIEEAGLVLQQMVTKKLESRFLEAIDLAADAFQSFFQISWEEIKATEPDDLPMWLSEAHGLDANRLEIAADLLRQSAEIAYESGNWKDCRIYLLQALAIQRHLNVTQPEVYSFTRVSNQEWLNTYLDRLDQEGHG